MLNNSTIKQYIKENNGKGTYLLKDKGEGDFIAKWDMDIPKPIDDDLVYAQEILDTEAIQKQAQKDLIASDSRMARLAEDLYGILVSKNIIASSDIDADLVTAIETRKADRAKLG